METTDHLKTNREFKDRLFRLIFNPKENREFLLNLYNAVCGTSYRNVEDIECMELKDAIYVKLKNDVGFLFDSVLSLYEHQSTYNPNMPLRGFLYYADEYRMILIQQDQDLYSKRLIKIPTPNYVVFYNGNRRMKDKEILYLSDSFENSCMDGTVYEWTATVLNINKGYNRELMEQCEPLHCFAEFVNQVKQYSKVMKQPEAVTKAVNEAIRAETVLSPLFNRMKAQVIDMLISEYDEEAFIRRRRREGFEAGVEEGIEGAVNLLRKLGKDDSFILESIMEQYGLERENGMRYL